MKTTLKIWEELARAMVSSSSFDGIPFHVVCEDLPMTNINGGNDYE